MSATIYKSFAYQFLAESNTSIPIGKYENINTLVSSELPYWIHFEKPSKSLQQRLGKIFNIDKPALNAFFNDTTSPRCLKHKDSVMLLLQGVNPNEDIDEKKMIRFLLTKNGLISIGTEQLQAVNDVLDDIKSHAFGNQFFCFSALLDYLIGYMSDKIYNLDEELDHMESSTELPSDANINIMNVRQDTVSLRRFVLPQREAIAQAVNKINLLQSDNLLNFTEFNETMMRQVETLKMIRERALIIQDNYSNQIGEISNRRMYVLTIIMLIFTPAFFVMGLFSMYVPIPGMNSPLTWWFVTLFIAASSTGLLALFKYKDWL